MSAASALSAAIAAASSGISRRVVKQFAIGKDQHKLLTALASRPGLIASAMF